MVAEVYLTRFQIENLNECDKSWRKTRFWDDRVFPLTHPQDTFMKRFALLSLLCLTVAAALAPTVPAWADQHKDNMTRRCNNGGC